MLRRMTVTTAFVTVSILAVLCHTQPALGGIGERDTGNHYANVGALALKDNLYNEVFQVCSGVLIADQVFLTAGHCTAWAEAWRWYFETGELEFIVTFRPDFYEGATPPDVDLSNFVTADDFFTHPLYGHDQANAYDLAVVTLLSAPDSVSPAQLPEEGFLDELKRAGAKKGSLAERVLFEHAGYGSVPALTGPPRGFSDGYRRYSTSPFSALTSFWLKHQQNQNAVDTPNHGGTCYGDSGAPHFFPGTDIVVGVVSWGDIPCRASDFSYRVDTAEAREFLGQFVSLP